MDATAVAEALDRNLPDELQPAGATLAALIASALSGQLDDAQLQNILCSDPALPLVLQQLAGRTLDIGKQGDGQIVISNSQLGDLSVQGDIVGGDKLVLTLTVNNYYPTPVQVAGVDDDPAWATDCPYPGLRPFERDDAALFFGREAEIMAMLDTLASQRLLMVIGPSGSGKTSAVLAGLLPRVEHGTRLGPGPWLIPAPVRFGAEPFAALEKPFGPLDDAGAAVARSCELAGARQALLVIDAFEELFTQADQNQLPQLERSLRALLRLPQLALVITMRAEFYHRLITGLPTLWKRIEPALYPLTSLDAAGLAQAIVAPAARRTVPVETALVARLVSEALGDRQEGAVLPFLQETLARLWESRAGGPLTEKGYTNIGDQATGRTGLQKAMADRAEGALARLIGDEDSAVTERREALVRRVMLRLLQFGDDGRALRRRQRRSELGAVGDHAGELDALLGMLSDARLIRLEPDEKSRLVVVDLVHEALIAGWPRLAGWAACYRRAELLRRRLEVQAGIWDATGRPGVELLSGPALAEAQTWLDGPEGAAVGYSVQVVEFIAASRSGARPLWNRRGVPPLVVASLGLAGLLALLALLAYTGLLVPSLAVATGVALLALAVAGLALVGLSWSRLRDLGPRLSQSLAATGPARWAFALGLAAALLWAAVGWPVAAAEVFCTQSAYRRPEGGVRSVALLTKGAIAPFYADIVRDVLNSYADLRAEFVPASDYARCARFFSYGVDLEAAWKQDKVVYSASVQPAGALVAGPELPGDETSPECQPFISFGQTLAASLRAEVVGDDIPGQLPRPVTRCEALDLNNEGYQAWKSNRPDDARRKYDQALAILPGLAVAYHNRGLLAMDMGQYQAAIDDFRIAIGILEYPDFLINLGIACRFLGDGPCVETSYLRAIALRPADIYAHNNLGVYLRDEGDFAGAEARFAQVEALAQALPGGAERRRAEFLLAKNRAIMLFRQNQLAAAQAALLNVERTRIAISTELRDAGISDFQEELAYYLVASRPSADRAECRAWLRYLALPTSHLFGVELRQEQAEVRLSTLRAQGLCP